MGDCREWRLEVGKDRGIHIKTIFRKYVFCNLDYIGIRKYSLEKVK
jgi:hypothetical protein